MEEITLGRTLNPTINTTKKIDWNENELTCNRLNAFQDS